jgi:hypothetical protein
MLCCAPIRLQRSTTTYTLGDDRDQAESRSTLPRIFTRAMHYYMLCFTANYAIEINHL